MKFKKCLILVTIFGLAMLSACSKSKGGSSQIKLAYMTGSSDLITNSSVRIFWAPIGGLINPANMKDIPRANPVAEIPNGNWQFFSVEWTGEVPYSGAMRCGVSALAPELKGGDTEVKINIDENNCGHPAFAGIFKPSVHDCFKPRESGNFGASIVGAGLFRAGNGSSGTPYVICNADQLNNIGANFSTLSSANFVLGADINYYNLFKMIGGRHPERKNFVPIGRPFGETSTPFSGTFDGRGYAIKGMEISPSGSSLTNIGFIRSLSGTVKNIRFLMPSIDLDNVTGYPTYIGIIAGTAGSTAIVQNISIRYGEIYGGSASIVGGAVGYFNNASNVDGFTKVHLKNVEVRSCGSTIGGLVGQLNGHISQSSLAEDDIEIPRRGTESRVDGNSGNSGGGCTSTSIGGLVGMLEGGSIKTSKSNAYVSGQTNVGGIAGSVTVGNIADSYSTSSVIAHGASSMAGGIVGQVSSSIIIDRSFHTVGPVIGESAGGIFGWGTGITCSNTFSTIYSPQIANCNTAGSGDKSYTTIRASATFADYTLITAADPTSSSLWVMEDSGYDYPRLAWERTRPCHGRFSSSNAYLICSREQLANLGVDLSGEYQLGGDIDLKGSDLSVASFGLTLFGNGYRITNLSKPLISTNSGNIFDLILSGVSIEGDYACLGSLAEVNVGFIKNVRVEGGHVHNSGSTQTGTGGLVGCNNYGLAKIESSRSGIGVSGNSAVGGFVGKNIGTIALSESYGVVNLIAAGVDIGGFVGQNLGSISESRANTSFISFSAVTNIGGFAGSNEGAITNSLSSLMNINLNATKTNAGAFVGSNGGEISNVYASYQTLPSGFNQFYGDNSSTLTSVYASSAGDVPVMYSTPAEWLTSSGWAITPMEDPHDEEAIAAGKVWEPSWATYPWVIRAGETRPELRRIETDGRTDLFFFNLLGI